MCSLRKPTRVAILTPSFNILPWDDEFATKFGRTCNQLRAENNLEVCLIFVDDGSTTPGTQLQYHARILSRLRTPKVLVRHCVNRGQGAALQTAIEIGRSDPINADYFVTFDGDGQHDPADIPPLISVLQQRKLNILFGNRFGPDGTRDRGMPFLRRCLRWLAGFFDRWVTGLTLGDAHNGLRAFDSRTAQIMELTNDRMAHATEIKILTAKHHLRYDEIPVRITYTKKTLESGQKNIDAVNVVTELIENWWFR